MMKTKLVGLFFLVALLVLGFLAWIFWTYLVAGIGALLLIYLIWFFTCSQEARKKKISKLETRITRERWTVTNTNQVETFMHVFRDDLQPTPVPLHEIEQRVCDLMKDK